LKPIRITIDPEFKSIGDEAGGNMIMSILILSAKEGGTSIG